MSQNQEYREIAVAEIRPNDWNPNKVDAKLQLKLENQIKAKGFIHPILVRTRNDAGELGHFEIVDGYHRWTAAKNLGAEYIPAIIKEMSDADAKLQTINANYMRGNPVPIKLAALIHDLNKQYTIADLEGMLPFDQVELKDNLELLKIPPDMDRVGSAAAGAQNRLEPVFISATIYKDKEAGLHEFIEQAMLESEATFCEIKIKIEAGEHSRDEVIRAVQNLKKVDTGADFDAGEEAPVVTRFALFEDQHHIVDQALLHIIRSQGLTKNARGRALELLAADYLAGAQPLDE